MNVQSAVSILMAWCPIATMLSTHLCPSSCWWVNFFIIATIVQYYIIWTPPCHIATMFLAYAVSIASECGAGICENCLLTQCDLMIPHGVVHIGQHWFEYHWLHEGAKPLPGTLLTSIGPKGFDFEMPINTTIFSLKKMFLFDDVIIIIGQGVISSSTLSSCHVISLSNQMASAAASKWD